MRSEWERVGASGMAVGPPPRGAPPPRGGGVVVARWWGGGRQVVGSWGGAVMDAGEGLAI